MTFTPGEATNLPIILQECQRQGLTLPEFKEDIAYILATARHETAQFKTLQEYGGRQQAIKYGYSGGANYFGRGYVQLTHDYNYRKFSQITGKDLVNNPDLVLEPNLAAFILIYGMKHGSFTGKKLDDFAYCYAPEEPEVIDGLAKAGDRAINFIPARGIVNGNDQAMLINNYAREYVIRINNGELDKFLEPKNTPNFPKPPPTIIPSTPINIPQIQLPTPETWQKVEKATGPIHTDYLKGAVFGSDINLNLILDGYADRVDERTKDKVAFYEQQMTDSVLVESLQKEITELKTKTFQSDTTFPSGQNSPNLESNYLSIWKGLLSKWIPSLILILPSLVEGLQKADLSQLENAKNLPNLLLAAGGIIWAVWLEIDRTKNFKKTLDSNPKIIIKP